jgi:hypothetical protein
MTAQSHNGQQMLLEKSHAPGEGLVNVAQIEFLTVISYRQVLPTCTLLGHALLVVALIVTFVKNTIGVI